ncbi:MAG: aromatic ring-hydroxylating dioxygenase subunit alpha [Acidimicrobiia bacterium]|nr:aromatic ring-hydroxylating dioxygenase subunit alpha [Acidimicrobiia bacterium]
MARTDVTRLDAFAGNRALRSYWHPVAAAAGLAGPLAVTLLGQPLVLWRDDTGAVVAAPDRCPHREAPLSAGHVDDGCLVCPYHGWTFGAGGTCVDVPSSAAGVPVPPMAHLSTVHVQERYGLVWVALDDPVAAIPTIPQDDDPAFRRINNPVEVWRTCGLRMVDNFLDISHFPYVHTGTFGIEQETTVPRIELGDLDSDFFGYAYEVDARNDVGAATTGIDDAVVHRKMSTGFSLPFTVRSTIWYETGLEHILLLCTTPVDDLTSLFTFVVWRNDDFSVSAEEVIAFDRAIGAEDRAMLERVPGVLPLSSTGVVSVQSDKPSVEWRRRIAAKLA